MNDRIAQHEVAELIDAAVDGHADETQMLRLDELLGSDPVARRYYVEHMTLLTHFEQSTFAAAVSLTGGSEEADKFALAHEKEANQESIGDLPNIHLSATPSLQSRLAEAIHWQRHRIRFNAMTAVLTALAWAGFSYFVWFSTTPNGSRPNRLGNIEYVAEITGQYEARWADDLHQNAVILSGERLNLVEGLIEITYYDGAVVILEAPAEFVVDSRGAGTLDRGKLTARIPQQAAGFVLNTPAANFTDLGTQFGVIVDGDRTEMHVFEGAVEVAFGTGSSVVTRTIRAGKALRFVADSVTAENLASAEHGFITERLSDFVARMTPESPRLVTSSADIDLSGTVIKAINFGPSGGNQTIGGTTFLLSGANTTVNGVTNVAARGAVTHPNQPDFGDAADDNAAEVIFGSSIYGVASLSIDVALANGRYTVQLLLEEGYHANIDKRVADILIEDALNAVDYHYYFEQDSTFDNGSIVSYVVMLTDGNLDIDFVKKSPDGPHLSGLIISQVSESGTSMERSMSSSSNGNPGAANEVTSLNGLAIGAKSLGDDTEDSDDSAVLQY